MLNTVILPYRYRVREIDFTDVFLFFNALFVGKTLTKTPNRPVLLETFQRVYTFTHSI